MGMCRVPGCPKQPFRRGYCDRHEWRVRRYGAPGPVERIGKWATLEDRFLNKINLYGPLPADPQLGCCAIWTGACVNGYGVIGYKHRQLYCHRVAYERVNGPIPARRQVGHLCGVRACVREDHLYLR